MVSQLASWIDGVAGGRGTTTVTTPEYEELQPPKLRASARKRFHELWLLGVYERLAGPLYPRPVAHELRRAFAAPPTKKSALEMKLPLISDSAGTSIDRSTTQRMGDLQMANAPPYSAYQHAPQVQILKGLSDKAAYITTLIMATHADNMAARAPA